MPFPQYNTLNVSEREALPSFPRQFRSPNLDHVNLFVQDIIVQYTPLLSFDPSPFLQVSLCLNSYSVFVLRKRSPNVPCCRNCLYTNAAISPSRKSSEYELEQDNPQWEQQGDETGSMALMGAEVMKSLDQGRGTEGRAEREGRRHWIARFVREIAVV